MHGGVRGCKYRQSRTPSFKQSIKSLPSGKGFFNISEIHDFTSSLSLTPYFADRRRERSLSKELTDAMIGGECMEL